MFEFDSFALASDAYRESIDAWLDGLDDILEIADSAGRDALMVWEEEIKAAEELDRYCLVEY